MKLKYKFKCQDLIDSCDYVTYGNRIKDIVERVKNHLVNREGFSKKEVNSLEFIEKIKSLIRESRYVITKKMKGGKVKCQV